MRNNVYFTYYGMGEQFMNKRYYFLRCHGIAGAYIRFCCGKRGNEAGCVFNGVICCYSICPTCGIAFSISFTPSRRIDQSFFQRRISRRKAVGHAGSHWEGIKGGTPCRPHLVWNIASSCEPAGLTRPFTYIVPSEMHWDAFA